MNTRRSFIKKASAIGLGASVTSCSFNINKAIPLNEDIIGHGDYQYRVQRDWAQLHSTTTPVINCHEMVMDSHKRLYLLTDHPDNNIIILDKSGKLLDSWTLGYRGAHGLTLHDEGGTEYLYITDTSSGSVVKTTLDGDIVMSIDPKAEGFYSDCQSYSPTETAIGPNGDIYIADGYGSQFITQFDAQGRGIRKFGGGSFLQPDKFKQVHGVAIDYRGSGEPTLLCTARIKNAFKRFTLDGKYIEEIYVPGAFVSRPVIHRDMLYSDVCFGMLPHRPLITSEQGFVTIIDTDGRVVSNPGGTAPTYIDGHLQTLYQEQPIFKHCHDVCVDDDENLYVLQWNANSVYPYKLHRV